MTDPDDEKYLHALLVWARTIDTLHDRYFANPREVQTGSILDSDDSVVRPYHMTHEVSQRLSVAVDSLHGLRSMTFPVDLDSEHLHLTLRTYAPYPLLRTALENACAAAWLLAPADQLTRVTRRFHLYARSHDAARQVESLMVKHAKPDQLVKPPRDWARDAGFIGRMRALGVPDIDAILKDPKRKTTSTTGMVDAGATALARGTKPYQSHDYSLVWRALSGASHGDLWALMSLPDRDILTEPDLVTDRVGTRVHMTAAKMGLWTDVTTRAVRQAITMYDRSRQGFTEHGPATSASPR